MAAYFNREAYRARRSELRRAIRTNKVGQHGDGWMAERARHQLAADRRSLLLLDCGTAEQTYPNNRLAQALHRNRRLVAERLHRERVERELPKVREAAKAAGLSRFDAAMAELSVSWGGKSAREALA